MVQSPPDTFLDTVGITDSEQFKHLTFHNSRLVNLRISLSDSDATLFYVDNSQVKPSVKSSIPDITLYDGADKNAPVLGVVHLTLAGANTIGLGNPDAGIRAMIWERLERTSKWTHGSYQFESWFDGPETRTKFTWRRTSRTPITGAYTLQLIEESKPDVVLAAYGTAQGMRIKTRGRLMIRMGHGELWERMVLLTALSIIELNRRRIRHRHYQ
jgi:hypothetical protein